MHTSSIIIYCTIPVSVHLLGHYFWSVSVRSTLAGMCLHRPPSVSRAHFAYSWDQSCRKCSAAVQPVRIIKNIILY